jgi:predicted NodU family carbamoyl transferase
MSTLAISLSGHDSSISLIADSEVVTTFACERTNREKHTNKVKQCDVDIIADNYTKKVDQLILVNAPPSQHQVVIDIVKKAGIQYGSLVIDNQNHHMFHAAASYYPLGLDDAICIVVDGAGSAVATDPIGQLNEVTSFFYANDILKTVYKKYFYRNRTATTIPGYTAANIEVLKKKYPYPIDITTHRDTGEMYGTVTRYIGFMATHAGKTMGLSAYGGPNNLPSILIPGTCITDNNLFNVAKQIDVEVYPGLANPNDTVKKNMAYNAQKALEKMFIDKVTKALTFALSKNIILSGGCSLNILGNSKVKRLFNDYNIYADPIGADSAQSLGAAYYYYKKSNPCIKFKKFDNLYYGPNKLVQRSDVDRLLRKYNGSNL